MTRFCIRYLATAAILLCTVDARTFAAEVVARISGIDLTSDEIRRYLDTLGENEQQALAKDPAALSQFVRAYLARQLVLKEARAKKWDQQPLVKSQLDRARDQVLAETYLDSVSRPPDSFPSEEEVKAAYQANKDSFKVPRQFRVAQIFVLATKGSDSVEKIQGKLRQKGADFAAIAREHSDEKESGSKGGEIGWLAENEMVPGIRSAVVALAKDAVSQPVRLDDGWHIIKLLDAKPASVRPLSEVRDSIASQLRAERARANRQAYLAKLLEQNPPTLNELALPKLIGKAK